ncbi:MAG: hypothetical protein R6X10_01345 [Desulfobacterales bacterium]
MKKSIALIITMLVIGTGIKYAEAKDPKHEGQHKIDTPINDSSKTTSHHFTYSGVDKGIRAEFEIMSLADMGMKPENGATHHIMFKIFHDSMNHQIQEAKGKIKIIDPDGKEQISDIKNYNGVFSVNTLFPKAGKYGVICLLKIKDEKPLFKFWYTQK